MTRTRHEKWPDLGNIYTYHTGNIYTYHTGNIYTYYTERQCSRYFSSILNARCAARQVQEAQLWNASVRVSAIFWCFLIWDLVQDKYKEPNFDQLFKDWVSAIGKATDRKVSEPWTRDTLFVCIEELMLCMRWRAGTWYASKKGSLGTVNEIL